MFRWLILISRCKGTTFFSYMQIICIKIVFFLHSSKKSRNFAAQNCVTMTNEEIERRAERAKELFKQGFNCSQSVFAACCDIYGITDEKLALRLAASFGGGIGRMRLTCGAACGMFMLAGLEKGSFTPGDHDGKMANYALVQDLAADFKATYGSLTCAELLGIAPKPQDPTPEARTAQYYEKRPCIEMIGEAVRIFLRKTQ